MNGQSEAKALTKNQLKYINKPFGVLYVIDFYELRNHRSFFYCTCTKCGGNTIVRSDHLLKGPKSCTNCVNLLQKEISEQKFPKSEKPYKDKYTSYKINAKFNNRVFDFTQKEFIDLLKSNCTYCGTPNAFGVDRIDNSIGYTKENSTACCKVCNQMKHMFSQDLFLKQVDKIFMYQLKQSSTTISKESTLQANGSGNGGDLVVKQDCDIV